jgi:hypothetical protein
MTSKRKPPSYLAALNSIALTEKRAHEFYLAWADSTADAELESVMRLVALREIEHAYAFQKRISELGYEYQDGPHPQADAWLELFRSNVSDLEKFRGFGFQDPQRLPQDDFADLFNDTTLDRETGALLGRYIAEERDSANLFLRVYARMMKEAA